MINIDAFRIKRKQLRAAITRNKRLLKTANEVEARRLVQLISDDEEQIAVFELMIDDCRARVQALYDADCYGPPQ